MTDLKGLSGIFSRLRVGLLGLLLSLLIPFALFAADTSGAFYSATITFLNVAISTSEIQAAFPLSGSSLIDGSFIEDDALNTVIQSGSLDQPAMPASNRTRMLGAIQDDGGVFDNLTTEANNATFADVDLLPSTPVVDDAFYFIGDNPFRILTLNIGQEAVHSTTGSFVYEYYNGVSYVTASNVDDRTNEFAVFGVNTISFDMPIDWVKTGVCCSIEDAYTFRIRLQNTPTQTQQPQATQIWYETGLWWTWIDEMDPDDQRSFVLFLGGPDMIDHHQIFLGDEGIITSDAAGLEVGNTYGIQVDARLTPDIIGACVVCKGNALRLFVSAADELTLDVTDGVNTTSLVISGITAPATGSQIIGIDSDGTTVSFSITGETTVSGTAVDVQDVADDWVWSTTGATVYLEHIAISTTGVFGEFESWNSQGEWNQGVFVDTESVGGQPNFTQRYVVEFDTGDGFWTEGCSDFDNTSTFTSFGHDGGGACTSVNSFFRFDNIDIPQGATITSAKLTFMPDVSDSSSTVSVTISAVAEDNAPAPSTFADAEGRAITTANVSWNPVPSFSVSTLIDGPDITSVIQEVVDRPGWNRGAIVIYLEDNGSTSSSGNIRVPDSTEHALGVTLLTVSYDRGLSLSNDFIAREKTPSAIDGADVNGWSLGCTGGFGSNCFAQLVDYDDNTPPFSSTGHGPRFGPFAIALGHGTGTGETAFAEQTLSANPGEVWSFSYGIGTFYGGTFSYRLVVTFRDSLDNILSTTIIPAPADATNYQFPREDGVTAPANTSSVRLRFEMVAGGGAGLARSALDGVMACLCNPAPNFPDASNRLTNPDFETVFEPIGTWTSQTVVPPLTSVQATAVFWDSVELDGFTSSEENLVVSISTTASGPFQIVTENGGSIPGINPGDDLSELGIQLRFTLQTTGSAPTIDSTPLVAQALLAFIGTADEGNSTLFYELRTTPSFTIEDLTTNAFDGDLNLPLPSLLPIAVVSALQPLTAPASAQDQTADSADFVAATEEPDDFLGLGGFGNNLPLKPLFDLVTASTGVPAQIYMIMIAMIVTIYAGVGMYYSFQSVTAGFAAMLISLIGFTFIDQGVVPWWTVFVFAFMGVFWVWSDRSAP